MNKLEKDYRNFAKSEYGVSSLTMDRAQKAISKSAMQGGLYDPTIIEERELNVAPMSVFSRLFMDRILFLGTDVNSDIANVLNSQLMYLNMVDDSSDIKMFINSPGGSVTDGLAIYDVMNFVEPDIKTYCMGMCASMASVLVSSGAKGKRYSLPHGSIMLHQVSGGTGLAQCADIKIVANRIQQDQDILYKILSENTGKTIEEITVDADRDHWLTPEEALNYGPHGLIDKIIKKSNE